MKKPVVYISLLVPMISLAVSCGKKSKKQDPVQLPIRSGTEVNTNLKTEFFDGKIEVADDGSKTVFISGRDGLPKAYLFQNTEGGILRRLTTTDIGQETNVKLNTEAASWAVISATRENSAKLYVQNLVDGSEVQAVSLGNEISIPEISHVVVAADESPLVAFVAQTVNANGVEAEKAHIFQITVDGSPSTPLEISDFDSSKEKLLGFIQGENETKLLSVKKASSGALQFFHRSYSGVPTSQAQTIAYEGEATYSNITNYSLSQDRLIFNQRVVPPGKVFREKTKADATTVNVYNQDQAIQFEFASSTFSTIAVPIFSLSKSAQTQNGDYSAFVGPEFVICKDKEFVAATLSLRHNESGQVLQVFPSLNGETWSLTTDPCLSDTTYDFKVEDAKLSLSSDNQLVITIQSWYSTDFELRQFRMAASDLSTLPEDIQSVEISKNPATL